MTDSKTSFTPGPWTIEGPDAFNDYNILGPDKALAIAAVVNGEMRRMGGKETEHEANAHLIEAAPDLYQAATGEFADEDPMLWRIEWLDGLLKSIRADTFEADRQEDPSAFEEMMQHCEAMVRDTRQALAKARGEDT